MAVIMMNECREMAESMCIVEKEEERRSKAGSGPGSQAQRSKNRHSRSKHSCYIRTGYLFFFATIYSLCFGKSGPCVDDDSIRAMLLRSKK